jgi:alanyl-tRNA synthetase
MHAALRNVLGEHVTQKGQMVDGERLRFDFSHGGPLTADELARIEDEVNAVVLQNRAAETKMMAPQQAIEAGAMALFGEKYGDEVRVLTLGDSLAGQGAYSVELCGGTHVARTGDIGLFKIIAEQGIAAGVRRIEGLTGLAARRWLQDQANVARDLADRFKVPVLEVGVRVDALEAQRRKLEKDLAEAKKALAMGGQGAGGKPDFAQGGAPDDSKAADGVAAVRAALS